MELTMFNQSDVISPASEMPAASDVTSLLTQTSEVNALNQNGVSSIPLLITKLFSKAAAEVDLQTKDSMLTTYSAVDGDGTTTTDEGLIVSTKPSLTSHSSPTNLDISNTVTSAIQSVSETVTSLHGSQPQPSISTKFTDSTTSPSFTVETGNISSKIIDSENLWNRTSEQSIFEQSTVEQAGISVGIHQQQSTDVGTETRSWVTNVTEEVTRWASGSQEFDTTQISTASETMDVVTQVTEEKPGLHHESTELPSTDSHGLDTRQFSTATEREIVTQMTEEKTFLTQDSAEVSSTHFSTFFHNVFHTDQDTASTLQSNITFPNTLVPRVATPCQFFNCSNNVTDSGDWQYPDVYDVIVDEVEENMAVTVAKVTTLAILAMAGVVGNALVIWSVVRQRHLHRPPFYYLLSLSLTDLSRAAFCLPLVLMTLLQGSVWRHGSSACDLFAFANAFFVLSSGVSLLDIAADRHLSLVYSRSYRRRSGGALNLVVVLLGWSLAFLVAFPPVVGVGSYAFEESEGQCTLRHKFYRHDNDTLGFLMVFTALMLVTLFLYYRIFLALRAHRKMRPLDHEPARSSTWTFVGPGANGQAFVNWVNGFGGTNVGNVPNLVRNPPRPNITRVVNLHVARNQHVTRLFFLMTVTFNLLWLPYQVLSYWRVFGVAEDINVGFVTVAAWLSYGQVAVSPVVYFSSRGPARPRPSRAEVSPQDKQEYLLESVNRKK